MKKIILIFSLLAPMLFGSDVKIEQKIYDLIIHTLIPTKTEIKVWCDNPQKEHVLAGIKGIVCISSDKDADFILLSNHKSTHAKGVKFVTSFKLLEAKQNEAVGGFFWQKGRPNILFLRKNLQKYHIKLPPSMQQYVEDEL